jgi:hypothetical protein
MNKRTEELMLEAGYAAPHLAGRAHKLVDLIVKECIEVIEPCKCGCADELELAIAASMIKEIKEHFGVE